MVRGATVGEGASNQILGVVRYLKNVDWLGDKFMIPVLIDEKTLGLREGRTLLFDPLATVGAIYLQLD